MSPTRSTYDYSLITRVLNGKIHGRLGNLASGDTGTDSNMTRDIVNSAARIAMAEVDFRGNIREAVLTPNLTDNQYDYVLPTDVKADRIIDLRPQATDTRGEFETYNLVSPEEFDRRKQVERGIYTILNDDLTRVLRISSDVDNQELEVSSLEDSAWTTFDSDAVNDSDVKVDNDDYTEGNGSIRFQTDTGDTTDTAVGIQNDSLATFNISSYLARGQAFVDAKLTVADTGIHQISLRVGSDSSNYYQISDSNQNDCTPFVAGWNKIRFDLQNRTTAGTPVDTAIDYAAIFWSRDTTTATLLHLNDTDWGFDNLILKRGKYYLLSYYTNRVWQDTAFSLVENSTHDSHALLVQNDEFELIVHKAAELASQYLRDYEDAKYYAQEYQRLKQEYLMRNPSQAGVLTTTRYRLGSIEVSSSDTSDSNDS
jgi:hypothetical protein